MRAKLSDWGMPLMVLAMALVWLGFWLYL